jgi:hypothetical protein
MSAAFALQAGRSTYGVAYLVLASEDSKALALLRLVVIYIYIYIKLSRECSAAVSQSQHQKQRAKASQLQGGTRQVLAWNTNLAGIPTRKI